MKRPGLLLVFCAACGDEEPKADDTSEVEWTWEAPPGESGEGTPPDDTAAETDAPPDDTGGSPSDDTGADGDSGADGDTGTDDTSGDDTAAPPGGDDTADSASPIDPGPFTLEETLDLDHSSAVVIVGEAAGVGLGWSQLGASDIDGDGLPDLLIGSAGSDTAGAAGVFLAPVSCSFDAADALLTGDPSTAVVAGSGLAGAGDLNGDGYADLVVGDPWDSSDTFYRSAMFTVLGPITGDLSLADADGRFSSTGDAYRGTGLGGELAGGQDIDGDGLDDVVSAGAGFSYSAFVFLGPATGTGSGRDADAVMHSDLCGYEVGLLPDLTGDGLAELVVGTGQDATVAHDAGAAYVFFGPLSASFDEDDSDVARYGESAYDQAGSAVSSAGDVDGDGYADLLIGGSGIETGGYRAGATYLVLGPLTGSASLATASAQLYGEGDEDYSGLDVAGLGDVDGDGSDDFAVARYMDDRSFEDGGAAYVVTGAVSGTLSLSSAGLAIEATETEQYLGAVYGPGDVDGDGYNDLLLGAPGADAGGADAGAVYLLRGAPW